MIYELQEGKAMTDIDWTDEYEALTSFSLRFDYGFGSVVPELYHYRSGSSLTSILYKENVVLRLTSAERFEDKLEGRAVEVYYDIALENMLNTGELTQKQFDELTQVEMPNKLLFIRKNEKGINEAKREEFDAYVICFSTVQDDPFMYDNYVHNKSTGGFCIALSGGEIKSLAQLGMKNEAFIRLIPVMYGWRAIQYIEEQVLKVIQNPFLYKNRKSVLGSVLQHVQFSAKRSRYSKENETRLVVYLAKNDAKEHPNLFRDTNDNGEVQKDYILFRIPKYMVFDVTADSQNESTTTQDVMSFIDAQGYRLLDSISE